MLDIAAQLSDEENPNLSHFDQPLHLRWRIANRALPLKERHLRALGAMGAASPLRAYLRTRLEWTLENLPYDMGDCVLCLDIASDDEVDMHLEPLCAAPELGLDDLCTDEGHISGVLASGSALAGTVWVERAGEITVVEASEGGKGSLWASTHTLVTASDTFARDLVQTLGYSVTVEPVDAPTALGDRANAFFLVSDEFGCVPVGSQSGPALRRLAESFEKLYSK